MEGEEREKEEACIPELDDVGCNDVIECCGEDDMVSYQGSV